MPKKSWVVQLEDGTHPVEMEHNLFSNKRTIRVDGQVVEEGKFSALDFGGDYAFPIGERQAALHMRLNGVWYKYDVSVGGFSVQTGKPVWPMQPIPRWSWIFVVACILIPVITLGGVVPLLIGAVGAYVCAVIGRSPTRTRPAKIAISVGTTLLSWVLFLVFISTVTGGRTLFTLNQPVWQEYQSQAGRYSILMLGKPEEQTQEDFSTKWYLKRYIASYADQSGKPLPAYVYYVTDVDYSPEVVRSGQENNVLDNAIQSRTFNFTGSKLTRQQEISIGTFPGREAEFDSPAQGTRPALFIKARYFLVNNRLYQLMVAALQDQGLPVDAQKFFDSFKLLEN